MEDIFIDRTFAIQQLGSLITYNTVPGNISVVEVEDVAFNVYNNGNVLNVTAGEDVDSEYAVFAIKTEGGWDTATETGGQGSWDVATDVAEELVVDKLEYGQEVTYRVHQNLFGSTDYLRIMPTTRTTIAEDFNSYDTSVVLTDASFLPNPTARDPGKIWIGSEQVHYGRKQGNTLSLLTRGAMGTSIQDHVSGTDVFSAEAKEMFNHLNPAANIWLDVGTRYQQPESWDEVEAGLNGIIDSTLGNNVIPTGDDILRAWDEMASSNVTVTTVGGTVTSNTTTTANITLSSAMTLTEGEAIKLTHLFDNLQTEVVTVTAVNGLDIEISASYNDTLDSFISATSTIHVSSFNYGDQTDDDRWDAAVVSGQTARSLADRANADYTKVSSIMRFLHNL